MKYNSRSNRSKVDVTRINQFTNGPRHAKTCLWAYADSEDQAGASAYCDQGLHCPLTESVVATKGMNGEQRPG